MDARREGVDVEVGSRGVGGEGTQGILASSRLRSIGHLMAAVYIMNMETVLISTEEFSGAATKNENTHRHTLGRLHPGFTRLRIRARRPLLDEYTHQRPIGNTSWSSSAWCKTTKRGEDPQPHNSPQAHLARALEITCAHTSCRTDRSTY